MQFFSKILVLQTPVHGELGTEFLAVLMVFTDLGGLPKKLQHKHFLVFHYLM